MLRVALFALLLAASATANAESIEEKAAICGACHGPNGIPPDKSIPVIWGQNAGYLYMQFRDFQKGIRKDDRMTAVAQNVIKKDAVALAEYFAAKPWPSIGEAPASKEDADKAKAANQSVSCTTCHLETFVGGPGAPRLAGQHHDYLLKQLTEFRDHARTNNPTMSDIANSVTPEQLSALAAYLAGFTGADSPSN